MRHRVYGKHLNRDKNERTALFRGLIRNLFLQESITTTEMKAKAVKGLVDKLISDAKKNTNAAKNSVISVLPQVEVSKKLIEEIAPRYGNRVSGFTTLVKLGRRQGDGTMMVKMSLISADGKKSEEKKGKAKESTKEEVITKEASAEVSAEEKRSEKKTRKTIKEGKN